MAGRELDHDWEEYAWETLTRGLRVASFVRQVVLVVTSLVAVGFAIALVVLFAADELDSSGRIAVSAYLAGAALAWALVLGVLYAIASLLEVQSSALAVSLPPDDSADSV